MPCEKSLTHVHRFQTESSCPGIWFPPAMSSTGMWKEGVHPLDLPVLLQTQGGCPICQGHCWWRGKFRFHPEGSLFLVCSVLCSALPLNSSATTESPSLARGSVNLLFSTKLSGKWGRKASICLPPPSSLLRPFLTTLHATHPYTMWRNKLHFFCVRKEQKCIWL